VFIYRYNKDGYKYLSASTSFVQGTQPEVFTSALSGFMLGFSAGYQIFSVFFKKDAFPDISPLAPLGERLGSYIRQYPFDFIIFFVSILCAIYFFKTAATALNYDIGRDENYYARTYINSDSDTPDTDGANGLNQGDSKDGDAKKNTEQPYAQFYIVLSFMPILWSFLNIFKCFFDMTKAVNSPVRIYELMCFLALSAYFVSEARMLVGRHKISRFFTYAYLSVIFVAVSAVPSLTLSAFWILKNNNSQFLYGIEIAFALYIAARIYSQIRYSKFILER